MLAGLAADLLVLIHFSFIIFVVLGGLLLLRWPRMGWVHLPAAAWGAWVEFAHIVCPLTPLEKRLRRIAGETGYEGGFIDRYITPLVYPDGLTDDLSFFLGSFVITVNALIYAVVLYVHHKRR